ncbi:hypothetical protein QVD17_36371 [Tagetes erecta]|uniref:Uncharacterized protein n=1 Tax=Tagetes erecta TaxID=13708 RepID=A0AAD8JW95_TARER|nr:hypothetical protein QVD17_36371 [Tagetes erecta]
MSHGGTGRHQRRSSQSVFDFPDDVLQAPPMADSGVSDKEYGHTNSPKKTPEQHCKRSTIDDVSTHLKEKSVASSLPPTSQKK